MRRALGLLIVTLLVGSCKVDVDNSLSVMELNSGWTYQEVDGDHSGEATVSGTIHTDLLKNKQIEDPFYRTNEKDLQWIDKKDWIYQTSFTLDEQTLKKDKIVLHFNGLDTYADVYLNNQLILEAFNMHREWTIDIKNYATVGENHLKVYLHSPIKKGLELYNAASYSYPASNDQSENGGLGDKKVSVFTRKAGYHYGWDWGPRFVTSGIWRSVEIRSWNDLNIESVYIKQPRVTAQLAELEAEVFINSENQYNAELIITNANSDEILATQNFDIQVGENTCAVPFKIDNPKLWWSNGLGDPNMYDFNVKVVVDNSKIASAKVTTGLRSIKLIREADKEGESFLFELNGIRVFAKGANYIPNDSFLPRVTKSDYEKVIADAVDANMNMLRVWGGGIYENDYFYELCNKNGIMVWQDFMFACSMYPGDDQMLANIKEEAIDNVVRLRNHPSIVLWCGNNEINTAWHHFGQGGWGWKQCYTKDQQEEIHRAYMDIFHGVLADVVDEYTAYMSYWPSSPQAGYEAPMHASDVNTSGDMHYWGVWHGLHRFEDFDKYKARFMSEYGFQSFPDFESVKTYTMPEDYDIESDVMAAHQRSGIGNLRIKEYMSWYYNIPDDFEQFLYMSQVLQAHGMRMGIEAHRRAMPYCMGSLYWQINDCWPVASWSSTDYYHKWKAMHYAVRNSFEPLMISTVNNDDSVSVYVVSDLLDNKKATLQTQLIDFNGNILHENSTNIIINANTSTQLETISIGDYDKFDKSTTLLVLRVLENDKELCSKYNYFNSPKNLRLSKPEIKVEVENTNEGTYLHISSDILVRHLYLYDKRGGLVLNDNYFDLLPNEKRIAKVLSCTNSVSSKDVNFRYISN